MADSENYHQLIENYLDGLLEPQVKEDFENRLLEDEELREELKTEIAARNFMEMAEENLLYDKFEEWDQRIDLEEDFGKKKVVERSFISPNRRRWLPLAVAAAIALLLLLIWPGSPEKSLLDTQAFADAGLELLANDYEDLIPQGDNQGDTKSDFIEKVTDFFDNQDISGLEKLLEERPNNIFLQLQLARSYNKSGQEKKAREFLASESRSDKLKTPDAQEYFTALFQSLADQDKAAACQRFKTIALKRRAFEDAAKEMLKKLDCTD